MVTISRAPTRSWRSQPARTETLVDVVARTFRQRRVRGVAVLVFPRVVGEQVTLDGRGDLATLEADARRHRRVRSEKFVEQPAQQQPWRREGDSNPRSAV
jgi:hypothetical protein